MSVHKYAHQISRTFCPVPGIYCYHFCQLCACVNEPFLTTQSMLPLDKIGNPEHALTIIIWYLRACSQLQKAIVSEHYH